MTENFDLFIERLLTEIVTPKNKRTSRYWGNHKPFSSASAPRKVKNSAIKTASQSSKLGYQQYIGTPFASRVNKSKKTPEQIAIAKGLETHIRPREGKVSRKPGSVINSKQGDMEVKYNLANGASKIGHKFQNLERPHMKRNEELNN